MSTFNIFGENNPNNLAVVSPLNTLYYDTLHKILYRQNASPSGSSWVVIGTNVSPNIYFVNSSSGSGTQGPQGRQGTTGVQGSQGTQGFQGSQGNQGSAGAQGSQGNQGFQGVQGSTGSQGSQGFQGNQGTQGSTGAQGSAGAQGVQGSTGSQGTQGNNGVAGGESDQWQFDDTVSGVPAAGYVTYNGANAAATTEIYVNDIDTYGNFALALLQNFATDDSLCIYSNTNPGVHDIFLITNSSTAAGVTTFFVTFITSSGGTPPYALNESITISVSHKGAQGSQGNQGATGAQGSQGSQGAQGSTGSQGTQGNQGAAGAQGTQGAQGATGAQGTQGFQGTTGAQGSQGFQGTTGAQGTQGFQGTTGAQGTQGFQGVTGLLPIATAAGTVDAITATFSPPLTLTNLVSCMVVALGANATTTPTFSPDGLTAHTITKKGGSALDVGDIPAALAVIILEYNSANSRWELLNPTICLVESAELSSTNNSGAANDTVTPATGARLYNFFTLPTTGKLYYLTGLEWKNGTVVAGNVLCGIDIVDASPPVIATVFNQSFTVVTAQSGTSAVQRVSQFERCIFRGGDLISVWVQFDTATARRLTSTVGSSNMRKTVTFTSAPARAEGSAWVAQTEQPYFKIYYREYK